MPPVTPDQYPKYMKVALDEALKGLSEGGIPIG